MIRAALHGDDPFAALAATLDGLPDDQARYVEMLDPAWQPSDTTLPNGTRVIVKVQRPGIAQAVEGDIAVLRRSARLLPAAVSSLRAVTLLMHYAAR